MSRYHENKRRAITHNTDPTLTDQAGAAQTDINIIMNQFLKTGQVPGTDAVPMYGDFTDIPDDFRGMLEMSRDVMEYRNQLPQPLRELPIEEILTLTPEDVQKKLAPPDPPANKPKEPPT